MADAARITAAEFRPQALPVTLVIRSALQDRLTAGAGQRLTIVTGTAGAGKSVLLSNWAAARAPGTTAWLSCDPADADPVRFWTGFIEAFQPVAPGFGADGAGLLRGDAVRLADVTASIARDARKLPAGSAIVVDDIHRATVNAEMADLAGCWPARSAQLVLSSRPAAARGGPVHARHVRLGGADRGSVCGGQRAARRVGAAAQHRRSEPVSGGTR